MTLLTKQEIGAFIESQSIWTISDDQLSMTCALTFTDFAAAFGFMSEISIHAEKMDHHPKWENIYNRVNILLTTHNFNGLTARDTALAEIITKAYKVRTEQVS